MCIYVNKYTCVDVYTCVSQCEVRVLVCYIFELLLLPFNVIAINGVAAVAPSCCIVVQGRSGSSTAGINLPHPRGRTRIIPSHWPPTVEIPPRCRLLHAVTLFAWHTLYISIEAQGCCDILWNSGALTFWYSPAWAWAKRGFAYPLCQHCRRSIHKLVGSQAWAVGNFSRGRLAHLSGLHEWI